MVNSNQNEYSEEGVYLYSLNTKTTTWEKAKYTGQIPSSKFLILDRYGHTASIIRQNIIFFGGWEFGKALNDINILLSK